MRLEKKISYHKKRLEIFNEQIKNYKFYDIYPKQSIEYLVNTRNNTLFKVKHSEIFECIENLIYTLEKNDNYQIALLNDNQTEKINNHSWKVKDFEGVIISRNIYNNKVIVDNSTYNDEISICAIYEPIMVQAFKRYFMNLWEEIAPINKDKAVVISWLKKQMKSIRNNA